MLDLPFSTVLASYSTLMDPEMVEGSKVVTNFEEKKV